MALLMAKASANVNDANGWNAVEAGATSQLLTRSASTSVTSAVAAYSAAFTITNTDVVDGVLMFLRRNGTTGTVVIILSNDNGVTENFSVTVNASDLPVNSAWVFFKFTAAYTSTGLATNKIGIRVGTAGDSGATVFRDATASNWSRLLRRTSTATAAAGDVLRIFGEHTGVGATNPITYTVASVIATDYGTGTNATVDNGIEICHAGKLAWSGAGATNSSLRLSGTVNVWDGGVFQMGASGAEIPRDSTATMIFDPTADSDHQLQVQDGGTLNLYGLSRTVGKDIFTCKLNADAAANATSLGVDTNTGWLDNDEIAVFSTTRTTSQTEPGTMNGNAAASTLTVDGFAGAGGGLLNAHAGAAAPVQAEVILLSRNVEIKSFTSTLTWDIVITALGVMNARWARFRYIGSNTVGERGIGDASTGTTVDIQYCAFRDTENGCYFRTGASGGGTFSNNVSYNASSAAGIVLISYVATSGVPVCSGNVMHGLAGITLSDVGLTFTNNTFVIGGQITYSEAAVIGNHSGNTSHSGGAAGFGLGTVGMSGAISSLTAWRNTGVGIIMNTQTATFTINTLNLFGNTTRNINYNSTTPIQGPHTYNNATINSDASFSTTSGLDLVGLTASGDIYFVGSSFGVTTAHTQDILVTSTTSSWRVSCINTRLASSTPVSGQANLVDTGFIREYYSTTPHYRTWGRYGSTVQETTTRHTASGYSWKLTPTNATNKLRFLGPTMFDTFKAPVTSGVTYHVTAWINYEVAYNGNLPRLVVVGGIVAGVGAAGTDLIDAVAAANAGNWDQADVTITPSEDGVVEWYIDCDGSAGSIYCDDMAVA